ncbi:MAG: hypothetical protein KJO12_04850 [Ignavibacteria bacterium]|nr:hypothetical protein [Ignavibacteria bacterium]
MAAKKISFYFVLYLVVLVELLAVIIERDNSELELKARLKEFETIQDSVISSYSQPILLSVQEVTNWQITGRDSLHILISVTNLQTLEEKAGVRYFFVDDKTNSIRFLDFSVITDKKTGNGHFYFKPNKVGTFNFYVFCLVRRKLPKYLPDIIREGIVREIGSEFTVVSDTVGFKINATALKKDFDRPGRS